LPAYVTLGTVVTSARTLDILLAALAHLDADVLLTTGWQNDPADLATIPANASAERSSRSPKSCRGAP